MNYKTYAEAKIANPDCEIVTTGKDLEYEKETIGVFEARVFDEDDGAHIIEDTAWKICHPADYCSTLKEFLEAGFKLVGGDKFIGVHGNVIKVKAVVETNMPNTNDCDRYILSAAALSGGCKIPKAEPWTIYNNTMPLSELNDERRGMLFNHHCNGGAMQNSQRGAEEDVFYDTDSWSVWSLNTIYRAKPKSERELFIENTTKVMRDAGTKCPDNHEYFGIMFDAGARYKDLTQHFGENI